MKNLAAVHMSLIAIMENTMGIRMNIITAAENKIMQNIIKKAAARMITIPLMENITDIRMENITAMKNTVIRNIIRNAVAVMIIQAIHIPNMIIADMSMIAVAVIHMFLQNK